MGLTAQPANTSSPAQLVGGHDGTLANDITPAELANAVVAFDTVFNSLVINVPGVTTAEEISTLIDYAEAREDVFIVIDPKDVTAQDQLDLAATYPQSSYAAVYYPNVVIADPTVSTSGATRTASPVGAVLGLYATTDASRGVFKSPAGTTSRLSGVVSAPILTNDELNKLNSATHPINPIKYVAGSGFVVMGARTLKPGYVDRYIAVRRSLIYLRKSLTDLTQYAVFEPNDPVLWRSLNATVSAFLTDFWSQGGLRGDTPTEAFFVKCDDELNTLAVVDEGQVIMEVGVALQRPAEYVIIRIGQFDGGATVTVTA
jgi:phage tail sheath protein FI